MSEVIAIIKLAPGEVGYYDELSKIHLTMSRPKANVYDYMNTSRLLRSVKSKTLMLVAGSLVSSMKEREEVEVKAVKEETVEIPPVIVSPAPAEPIIINEAEVVEQTTEEVAEVITEEVIEETIVETTVEAKKEKKSRNKKKKEE